MFTLLFFILIIVSFSFLCSMAEAAILSVSTLRVKIMLEQKRHGARDLMFIKDHISLAIASLVILNNSVNIIGSMYIGQQVYLRYGDHWLGIISAGLTFLIVILGEVIPKAIGERFKNTVSLSVARIVRILTQILKPFVIASTSVLRLWSTEVKSSRVTEEEIMMMLKIGHDAGTVETDEVELCQKVFRLKDMRCMHIMKPLKDAYMLPHDQTLTDLKDRITSSPYNRIVVYERNTSHVVGIVQHRILLREMAKNNYSSKVEEWMLKPIFVNHMMTLDTLMEKFQTFHQHLFIVSDNFGKNVGLVTMEDVLEELFGEIYDEKDVRFKNLGRGKGPKVNPPN